MRRPWVFWLGIGLLTSAQTGAVRAQAGDSDKPESDARPERRSKIFIPSAPGVTLPTDIVAVKRLEAAHDYIKKESWGDATRLLQALLDTPEDVLVGVRRDNADGKEVICWTGARTEASRLLAALPAQGREFYETVYGPRAKGLLTEANQKGDVNLLAEVARRYFHTASGAEATRLLGLYHLDRGRHDLAAVCFGRLLDREDAERLPPATLVASALAFRMAGYEARAEKVWQRLAAKSPSGVRLRGQLVDLPELDKQLTRIQTGTPSSLLPEGGARAKVLLVRPEQNADSATNLEARWTNPTAQEDPTRTRILLALKREEDRYQLALPAAVPLAAGDKVVYRSHGGIHAVDRTTGKMVWETASEWSFDRLLREPRFQPYLDPWINGYAVNNPLLPFANATLGTFSTDGSRIYAVEDLPLPPFPISMSSANQGRRRPFYESDFGPDLTDPAQFNRLLALDAESGKVVWEVGGRGDEEDELTDCYFLGPPLPLDSGLYGVIEKNQELRLVCLDGTGGTIRWSQALAIPPDKLLREVGRRVKPLRPACAEGILVCPTDTGIVVGVDLFHRSLAWAYAYREEAMAQEEEPIIRGRFGRYVPRELARVREDWKVSAPIVHAGKVILTAPDAAALQCLNLHNGALLWKVERKDDDLYLAGVFGDKVVIVGKQNCRALRVADGKQLWSVETGLPSGRGVVAGDAYYLPLKAALPEKQPAVYAIGLEKGAIRARIAAPKGEVPGNLLLCGEDILSQTTTALTAYTRIKSDEDPDK
jgi:outer membrane protein assembly factor BamB